MKLMKYDMGFKSKGFLGKVLVYGFIMLLPFLVFYWQVPFLSKMTIGNDYVAFPLQQQMELQYSLARGSFPLFIPGFAGGQAAAALTLGQMFHPFSHLAASLPGYWQGNALQLNTLLRLLSLGLVHLGLFLLLVRLGLSRIISFIISFITVYNLRMLDLFHYGASLENYTGYLFLCLAVAFYYLKPTRFLGPAAIVGSTYLLVCGGHPQMMYLGLLGAGIAAAALPFIMSKISTEIKVDRQRLVKYFITVGVCVFCGILLASAYIIPFYFDFILTNAQRVGQGYRFSLEYSSTFTGMLNSFLAPLQSEVQGAFGSSPLIFLVVLIPLLYVCRVKVPVVVTALWGVVAIVFTCGLGSATPLHYYFWKYFPLARSFRVPGRLSMIFPFLFLLLLAWLFRRTGEKTRPFYFFPALLALPLFLFYNWFLLKNLPRPKFCLPAHIKSYPPWVDALVFWLGLLSLILVIIHSLSNKIPGSERTLSIKRFWRSRNLFSKRFLAAGGIGIVLAAAVIFQVAIEFRFATWVVKRTSQPTLAAMDQQKQRSLNFRGDPGHGMETEEVYNQKRHSILEPVLAKFYRYYKSVSSQDQAYLFLKTANVTETIAVEAGLPDNLQKSRENAGPGDRIKLEENTFNRYLFSVVAQAPGVFALAFPYSGGWRAEVDGKRVEIYRGNGYLQAVFLEAGEHRLEFRFWSKAAFAGMVVSCVVFLLLGSYVTFFIFTGRKRLIGAAVGLLVPLVLFLGWYRGLYRGENLGTRYTWSSRQFPPARNLAYAKKTYMSSLEWLFYAGLGVDGEKGKRFDTGPLGRGWWQVDLGAAKQLGEIVIDDRRFLGRKNLPLRILGSINGKTFTPLKRVAERGQENPWRIPMAGEITRIVRLQSSTKKPLSFSEVEIYPPGEMKEKGKPSALVGLVRSEPVTAGILRKIALFNQAVESGDENRLEVLLAKEKKAGKETKKILLFEAMDKAIESKNTAMVRQLAAQGADVQAVGPEGFTPLMRAVEKEDPGIAAVLRNYGAHLPPCLMDLRPQKIIAVFMDNRLVSAGDKEIKVWNPGGSTAQEISTELLTFAKWGTYEIDSLKVEGENTLRVRVTEPGKEGIRKLHLGYEANREGLEMKISEGRYVHFLVRAAI
jgi:hypothetical protein